MYRVKVFLCNESSNTKHVLSINAYKILTIECES
jgi:hypothetical protein